MPEQNKCSSAPQDIAEEDSLANTPPSTRRYLDIGSDARGARNRIITKSSPVPYDEMRLLRHSARRRLSERKGANMKVLIVEDNEVHSLLLQETMKHFGLAYDVVCNGKDAIDMLLKSKYDVALLDIRLPEVRGDEIIKYVRAFPGCNASTPIVVVSADAMKGDHGRFLELGASEYVAKPFYRSDLLTAMCRSLMASIPCEDRHLGLDALIQDKKFHIFLSMYEKVVADCNRKRLGACESPLAPEAVAYGSH
jgi:CheY-like chemotaxis protein